MKKSLKKTKPPKKRAWDIICADCCWSFSDKLTMSDVARGAQSQYPVLDVEELKKLEIADIASDDAVLALWVPSSLLQDGLDVMAAWGFKQKQVVVWEKLTKNGKPAFGMGRIFRNNHEMALIGTRGKISSLVKNKSQRTVFKAINLKHSAKPEEFQDMLDKIFSDPDLKRLELFARRDRPGWTCLGNECPSTFGRDIRDCIKELKQNV